MGSEHELDSGLILDINKIREDVEKKLHFSQHLQEDKYATDHYLLTGIPGFDDLFQRGIPRGANVVVSGGAGSGKTIFCLQTLAYHAKLGKKCLYMSFEEDSSQLLDHMKDFGWNPDPSIEKGNLKLVTFLTSDIYYDSKLGKGDDVNAMIAKQSDSILMDLEPLAVTETLGFKPDIIVLDSLSAVSSTFMGRERSYRFYVERLFRFFKGIGCTTFMITETKQVPEVYSSTGVEEFLADGVIVLYNIRHENIRERAIEVLKMRGTKHVERIVAVQITDSGIVVYPKMEVFCGIDSK